MRTTIQVRRKDLLPDRWKQDDWRALYFLNLFRLALASTFTVIAVMGLETPILGARYPELFLLGSLLLLGASIFYFLTISFSRLDFIVQACIHFTSDLALITLITYASGGIKSDPALIYLIIVAAAGVVLPRRLALFFAALGTVLIFLEHLLSSLKSETSIDPRTLSFLGMGMFLTSLLTTFLAERARRVEAVSEEQQRDIVALEEMNALVVESMDTGAMVVAPDGRIYTMNSAGKQLLSLDGQVPGTLEEAHPELKERFESWFQGTGEAVVKLKDTPPGTSIMANFMAFGEDSKLAAIFLSDEQERARQALEQRLSALGRLAAAIAHEIRNPLTAINSAVELMRSSPGFNTSGSKIFDLVERNCQRINRIVNDTLSSANPDDAVPDKIPLYSTLRDFADEFTAAHHLERDSLTLNLAGDSAAEVFIRFSPTHLHQVLDNLCSNAVIHHGTDEQINIVFRPRETTYYVYLDISSNGPVIDEEVRDKIFEPFFTTRQGKGGTGLGLYLCKQLCELNQADLLLVHPHPEGNCFRIFLTRVMENQITNQSARAGHG